MEKIEQRHREAAVTKIKGDDPKSVSVRSKILLGECDDHPSVQACVFYERVQSQ